MTTQVYLIRALTNLHPGSGDADYGIVDKLVQRDPITSFPTVHMSGIKGALREYFENHPEVPEGKLTDLFGSAPQANSSKMQQGSLRFISAEVLVLPRPSQSDAGQAYDLCFVPDMVGEWLSKVQLFDSEVQAAIDDSKWKDIPGEAFKTLSNDLPVVARNYLDDGQSKNLWYEEFVPRETRFGCVIQGPQSDLDYFHNTIDGQVIQIGGNATVGYGYCLFESIVKTVQA